MALPSGGLTVESDVFVNVPKYGGKTHGVVVIVGTEMVAEIKFKLLVGVEVSYNERGRLVVEFVRHLPEHIFIVLPEVDGLAGMRFARVEVPLVVGDFAAEAM